MDECDIAQVQSEQFLERSLKKARQSAQTGKSLTRCMDCGAKIPEKRRKAIPGCTRCVTCQTQFERMAG